ncbi:cell division control protein 45 [Crucibulum laeve]|uniref:Cell division control protein 45 n=1 Tax=Crucibulum laeve TaxID=68775 RepID=A0A5C3MB98_9AGAR|nr:cell division control protein 45 [Crucibulum laeve]
MVFLPPPQLASGRNSYVEAYNAILTAHRKSPLTSASSVIMLVAPNVDALCASRMLADLFKQDDVGYRIRPVAGLEELGVIREELQLYAELHTLILINMGGFHDLSSPEWFGEFSPQLKVHVIDSMRPYNLANLFKGGETGERILVWDDGEAEKLNEERKAWETIQSDSETENSDDEDSDEEQSVPEDEDVDAYEDDGDDSRHTSGKRRSKDHDDGNRRKRQRTERPYRMSREERYRYSARISKYYGSTWYGQSASGTIYILATVLERVDNDSLWLAILGLTYQYITSRISREYYETYHSIYYDEVSRLNPSPPNNSITHSLISLNPDDVSVRATEELRFMLFRHWTLYDAMYHSSYVASKLGIWKERGKKRLTGLLAKMGFSIPQTQQPYSHMDMDLKKTLVQKLNDIAPEYGLVELTYPSFMRCYGYHSQPLSAADAVEGINALLDLAGGVRIEIETEGTRNGGEWFGGGHVWEAHGADKEARKMTNESASSSKAGVNPGDGDTNPTEDQNSELGKQELAWWVRNFWVAYDALTDISALRESLNLSMSLHRAIIRQGTSIIDKQDIRTMRNHRVVILTQGPDLTLFAHPGVLSRLALWLVDALRDRLPVTQVNTRSKRPSLPFVVACLNESTNHYVVVGVMAALDFGDVRKNEFHTSFLSAQQRCNASPRYGSFDTSVLEITKDDLKPFLEALCESPDMA